MYRTIRAEKVIDTAARLAQRVRERFPDAGLAAVAEEILAVARETEERCRRIRRPNLPLRLGVVLLIGLAVTLGALVVRNVRMTETVWDAATFIQVSESLLGDVVFLGAAIAFLVTLETRMKRGRALSAINELRALAHIIDMHQLTKDPQHVLRAIVDTPNSPTRTFDRHALSRYLDYCSEMLSLTGKIAALYVQRFDDPVVLAAVNEVEALATGLSGKIWQKLMILDGLRYPGGDQSGVEQTGG
jgi:hypothetical protein